MGDADYLSRQFEDEEKDEDLVQCLTASPFDFAKLDLNIIDRSELQRFQSEDPIIKPIINEISNPNELDSDRQKISKIYSLIDGLLFRKVYIQGSVRDALFVPIVLIRDILYEAHDSEIASHFGSRRTYYRVIQSFYWKGMVTDIKGYVRSCHFCQM